MGERVLKLKKKIKQHKTKINKHSLPDELHPILQQIYLHRGISHASDLERGLDALLSYEQLLNINEAAKLIFKHIKKQNRILIVGDFDADGATSSALAVSALKAFGAKHVDFLVPNRFEYGYGLTPEIVQVALSQKPDLIITVDNGISSCDGVDVAKKNKIDVLITDHHLQGHELPKANVIVNPNQEGDTFPSKNLAGVGVIFYVMCALRSYLREKDWFNDQKISEPNMAEFLDLVALGTIADVVPLDKNNRILIHQGLLRIRAGNCRVGLKALIEISKRDLRNLSATDLAYAIGPRLNAAGRLDDMSLGIDCLLSKNMQQAFEMAQRLSLLNEERRVIENQMQEQAWNALKKLDLEKKKALPLGLCLYDQDWHQGVIGLLASRVKERLNRPVIAFALVDSKTVKGSARSVEGLHIRDALDSIATQQPNLLTKFGGHAMAAGLTIELKNLKDFFKAFDDEVKKHLDKEALQHVIYSDGELTSEYFSLKLAELIQDAGPWGHMFPEPLFHGRFRIVEQRLVGQKHLKLLLACGDDGNLIDAIAFNVDTQYWPNYRCDSIEAAFRLDINEYRNLRKVQLIVEYFEEMTN